MSVQQLLSQLQAGLADVPAYTPVGALVARGDLASADMTTLAASINAIPFEPSQLGSRGLFEYDGEQTNTIQVEFDGQLINVVPVTTPGTAGIETGLQRRTVKPLIAPRIARKVTVLATEVAGIRALGSTELETVQTKADRKIQNAVRDIRATLEYHRMGACVGKVIDADGSELFNYFDLLEVEPPTYDVKFGTAGNGKFIRIGGDLKNLIEDALGNLAPGGRPPIVFCGRTFFQKFVTSADVTVAYQYFQSVGQRANPNRDDVRYDDFEHGGVIWRQYRGAAANTGRFIHDDEAHLVVDGVPGAYLGFFCPPADIVDKVNTVGVPLYPTVKTLDHGAGYEIQIQCNPIHVMTRPAVAIKLTSSN